MKVPPAGWLRNSVKASRKKGVYVGGGEWRQGQDGTELELEWGVF